MRIAGARILLTGASSGIGAAAARMLAERGAVVGLVGRRRELLDAVLADCRRHSPGCQAWALDLSDLPAAEDLVSEATDSLKGLDILVNNAAVPKVTSVPDLTPAVVEEVMRVNFHSPVRMTLRALPRMLRQRAGMIVNVASVGGRMGIAHEAAYCASKFALSGWSEVMAIDLAGTGVDVRLIQPGPIATDIWDRPGERHAVYDGPKEPPEVVARGILAAIEGSGFEHYLPDLKAVVDYKQSDTDGYLAMAASMAQASPAVDRSAQDTSEEKDRGR
jgi:short-subunit dehydrogenase